MRAGRLAAIADLVQRLAELDDGLLIAALAAESLECMAYRLAIDCSSRQGDRKPIQNRLQVRPAVGIRSDATSTSPATTRFTPTLFLTWLSETLFRDARVVMTRH